MHAGLLKCACEIYNILILEVFIWKELLNEKRNINQCEVEKHKIPFERLTIKMLHSNMSRIVSRKVCKFIEKYVRCIFHKDSSFLI